MEVARSSCGQDFIALVYHKFNIDNAVYVTTDIPKCLSEAVAERVFANRTVTLEAMAKDWYPTCKVVKHGQQLSILRTVSNY